jgi:hypothetical protein
MRDMVNIGTLYTLLIMTILYIRYTQSKEELQISAICTQFLKNSLSSPPPHTFLNSNFILSDIGVVSANGEFHPKGAFSALDQIKYHDQTKITNRKCKEK